MRRVTKSWVLGVAVLAAMAGQSRAVEDVEVVGGGRLQISAGVTLEVAGMVRNQGTIEIEPGGAVHVAGAYVQLGIQSQLMVNGTLQAQGGVAVFSGRVGGEGIIPSETTFGPAILAPGQGVGTLAFKSLHIQSGTRYEFEIDGPAGDSVSILGTGLDFTFDTEGSYRIGVSVLNAAGMSGEYVMFSWAGRDPLTDTEWEELGHRTSWSLPPGFEATWDYRPAENQMVMIITPEPAAIGLLGVAGGLLVRARRRGGVLWSRGEEGSCSE